MTALIRMWLVCGFLHAAARPRIVDWDSPLIRLWVNDAIESGDQFGGSEHWVGCRSSILGATRAVLFADELTENPFAWFRAVSALGGGALTLERKRRADGRRLCWTRSATS